MKIEQSTWNYAERLASVFVAVSVVGIWGCSSDDPITAQSSKYEVAEDGAAAAPAANAPAAGAPAETTGSGSGEATRSATRAPGSADTPANPAGSQQTETPPRVTQQGDPEPPKPTANFPGKTAEESEPPEVRKLLEELAGHRDSLRKLITGLQGGAARQGTQEEVINNLIGLQRQIIQTADKILASKASEPTLLRAAETKIQSLTFLSEGQPEAAAELKAFVAELKNNSNQKLVQLARHMEFGQRLQSFANGEPTDVPKLVADFKKVFEDQPKDAALFTLSQQVTQAFFQASKEKEAVEIMKLVAATFAGHKTPELANAAKIVREQLVFIEVDLDSKIDAIREKKPNSDKDFLAALDQLFKDRDLSETTLQFLARITPEIEAYNPELYEKVLAKMVAAFEKNAPQELASAVKDMATNFAKRKSIIGRPIMVDGVTLDGQPFDWGKYQGKVVLIDFWATWCVPCLKEIPNIKQNYEQYRDQGFEVVGINIDQRPEDLQLFFSRQKLPWTTVLHPDPNKPGQHPLMDKLGVESIPFLVLVGRDGKAIALNPRGPELGKKLAELFDAPAGPAAAPAAPAPAAPPGKAAPTSDNPLRK